MVAGYMRMSPVLAGLFVLKLFGYGEIDPWVVIALVVGTFIDLTIISFIRIFFTKYSVSDQRIIARAGITKRATKVSLAAITNVVVKQTKIEKKLGVGTVVFSLETGRSVQFIGVRGPEDALHVAREALSGTVGIGTLLQQDVAIERVAS